MSWTPHVTEVLVAAGLIDTTWLDERGRWRGSAVHRACELDDLGDLDESSVSEGIQGYLEAYRRFKGECRVKWSAIERPLTHLQYAYRGTPDRVGEVNSWPAVLDLKTGAPLPVTAIQLAAYEALIPATIYPRRYALHLRENGKYTLHECRDVHDKPLWFSALAVTRWRYEQGLYRPEERKED